MSSHTSQEGRSNRAVRTGTSRRAFLAGVAASLGATLGSCTGLRVLLSAYPARYDRDFELIDRTLRAFVTAVIPGARRDDPDLVRAFADPRLPFRELRGYFVYDVGSRTGDRFSELPLARRTLVVEEGLAADDVTARLYRGAIFLAQAAFYGGMYGAGDCAMIDFPGPNRGFPLAVKCYVDARSWLATESSTDGNCA